jgi:blue light- and temperature-responsive anti-repressor
MLLEGDPMESNLYKLVYCSRNRIQGSNAEVTSELQTILSSARRNNPALGLTGALLYNEGNFAQVLEGPLKSVERIFEMIQRDPRHSEVTVVHNDPATGRDFPEWSMAFAGSNTTEKMPLATAAFESAFANVAGAGEKMLAALKDLVVVEDDWILLHSV